jgi:ABC-type multidrug transport system fused ATPase/permease subunit
MHAITQSRWLGWKVIGLLGRHRRTLLALSLLILVSSGLDIAVPFLTRSLIDNIVRSLQSHAQTSLRALLYAAGGIFAATAVTRILRSFYNYRLFYTASVCEDQVKNAAYENFLRLDTAYHSSINTGEVVGALDRGGTAIFVVLFEILGQNLIPPLVVLAGVLISLFLKSPWIAAIVFLPLPVYVLTVSKLSGRMHALERDICDAYEQVTKEEYDVASNVATVKKFSRERQEAQKQRELLYTARDKHYRGERLWAIIENAQTFIATAGRVGVIALGGYFVISHRCTVGDYVLFIAMQDMVYGPVSQLSIILPKLRRNLSRAERLFEILEERPKVCDSPGAAAIADVRRCIEFRNLGFQYAGSDRWTLRHVNFTVPAGATVALIGPSGSGKSTLMKLLQRLYDPQEGGIFIDGCDLREIAQRSLRDLIAIVPQEVDLFSRTILENIGYGHDAVPKDQAQHAARLAQAEEFIERCESGFDTQVGERGLKLSGGERQRIGIARAVMRNPKILILDEATSHLDNESERLIQGAMEKLREGRTSFVIAHRLSTVRKADLVVVFSEGGIEAIGTHEYLSKASPMYRKLHAPLIAPIRVIRHGEGEIPLPPAVGE